MYYGVFWSESGELPVFVILSLRCPIDHRVYELALKFSVDNGAVRHHHIIIGDTDVRAVSLSILKVAVLQKLVRVDDDPAPIPRPLIVDFALVPLPTEVQVPFLKFAHALHSWL